MLRLRFDIVSKTMPTFISRMSVFGRRDPGSSHSNFTSTTYAGHFLLDPLSAIDVIAAHRSVSRTGPPEKHHIALATGHPAKFATAVEKALEAKKVFHFQTLLPGHFVGLDKLTKRS